MILILADILGAFTFLTVLPLRHPLAERAVPGHTFSYYPLVGLVIGLIVALAAMAIRLFPVDLAAFLVLLAWVALSGGLHLDGFADACDGLLATVPATRRLEIMKDPRTGSWAVIGLILLLLGKYLAVRTLLAGAGWGWLLVLIIPPVAGRWAMVLAVAAFPRARSSGLAVYFRDGFGRPQVIMATTLAVGLGLLTLLTMFLLGTPPRPALIGATILAMLAAPGIALGFGRWAADRLGGGVTGDIYGAICELVELTCLLILCLIQSSLFIQ